VLNQTNLILPSINLFIHINKTGCRSCCQHVFTIYDNPGEKHWKAAGEFCSCIGNQQVIWD
jgi:hypothetical protein